MARRALILLLALALMLSASAGAEKLVKFKNVSVHDPSVMFADGMYYIYGSHMQAAKSADLQDWKMFSKLDKCNLQPSYAVEFKEALTFAETGTFWAPDVIQLNDGRYYMYYCCCEGSKPLSALGVAVSDSPEGPFENIQVLLKSGYEGYDATRYPNAIDPCVFWDKDGQRLWMVYGSYSGGIFLLELDPETGLIKEDQEDYGVHLLGGNHARIEAPYMIYNAGTDYYYLFLSFGGLGVNDGYNIRVCRSRNVEGPYEDAKGQSMLDCKCKPWTFWNDEDTAPYGVKLMGGYQLHEDGAIVRSPGHNSAIETGDGWFLIHHTRFAPRDDRYIVQTRRMWFNDYGWPVVSPTRMTVETPDIEVDLTGAFRVLSHGQDVNTEEHTAETLVAGGDFTVESDGDQVVIVKDDVEYHGFCAVGYDEDRDAFVSTFTAMSEDGLTLWGVKD